MVKNLFERRWRIAVWAAIAFTAAYTLFLVVILATSFTCIHLIATGDPEGMTKAEVSLCLNTANIVLVAGVFSVISDCYAIFLPWVMTRRLPMTTKQRWAMNALFGSSALIIIAACFRTKSLVELHRSDDPSWSVGHKLLWIDGH